MKKVVISLTIVLMVSNFLLAQKYQSYKTQKEDVIEDIFNKDLTGWTNGNYDTVAVPFDYRDKVKSENLNIRQFPKGINYSKNGNKSISEITYSEEYIFNQDETYTPDIVCLDETHFVVAYPDTTLNHRGIIRAGTIYPDTIIFGEKIVFHSSCVWNYIQLEALSPTRFAIAYIAISQGGYKGYAIIGDVTGNDITFGPTCIFNHEPLSSFISLSSMTPERIVISFSENDNSILNLLAVVGTIVNDSIIFSNEYPIYPGWVYNSNIVLAIDSVTFVDIFSCNDWGKATIGTYSGNSISYSNVFEFNYPDEAFYIAASYLGNNKIAISYTDYGDDFAQNAIIATLINDSITFGKEYTFHPPTLPPSATYRYQYSEDLDTSNFVISMYDSFNSRAGSCILGTVYGDSIDFTPPYVYNPHLTCAVARMSKMNSSHYVIAYPYAWDSHGSIKIGTISIETSVLETQTCPNSVQIPVYIKHVDDIVEFLLKLDYDTSKLIYNGFLNPNTQLSTGTLNVVADSSKISINWFSIDSLTINADTLLVLEFAAVDPFISTHDSLTWNTPSCYFLDSDSLYATSIYENGSYYIDPMADTAGIIIGPDSVYSGTTGELYMTTAIQNATSYLWRLEPDSAGTINGNDTSVLIDFTNDYIGTAILSVMGSNNCGNGIPAYKTIDVKDSTVGNKRLYDWEPQVQIWPNPSNGKFFISLTGINNDFNVYIYDSNLNLVFEEEIQPSSNLTKITCNVDIQSSGIYTIRLCNEKINLTRKVVCVK